MDVGLGHHADVVVRGDRAWIFYFCHPYAMEKGASAGEKTGEWERLPERLRNMAVVQAAELSVRDGELVCDRNAPVTWP